MKQNKKKNNKNINYYIHLEDLLAASYVTKSNWFLLRRRISYQDA